MRSWPLFRQQLEACSDCRDRTFVELPSLGHTPLFMSPEGRRAFNEMVRRR